MDTNEIDFIFTNTATTTEDIMESSDSEIFNDLEDIMDREIATPLIVRLDYETPITVNALAKVTGMSQTALTIALVALGGRVGVKDGGLIRLPEPEIVDPPTRGATGPRGPTAKTAPRQSACREALMSLIEAGPVTAVDLLKVAEGRFIYTDILLIARSLTEAGLITENKKGRKASWGKPAEE
jgi:DNA-binding transcriptional ArsR family regulator